MAWGCLLLFYKNYIVYQNFGMFINIVFMDFYQFTKFRLSIQSGFWDTWVENLKSNNNNNDNGNDNDNNNNKKMKNCENELLQF